MIQIHHRVAHPAECVVRHSRIGSECLHLESTSPFHILTAIHHSPCCAIHTSEQIPVVASRSGVLVSTREGVYAQHVEVAVGESVVHVNREIIDADRTSPLRRGQSIEHVDHGVCAVARCAGDNLASLRCQGFAVQQELDLAVECLASTCSTLSSMHFYGELVDTTLSRIGRQQGTQSVGRHLSAGQSIGSCSDLTGRHVVSVSDLTIDVEDESGVGVDSHSHSEEARDIQHVSVAEVTSDGADLGVRIHGLPVHVIHSPVAVHHGRVGIAPCRGIGNVFRNGEGYIHASSHLIHLVSTDLTVLCVDGQNRVLAPLVSIIINHSQRVHSSVDADLCHSSNTNILLVYKVLSSGLSTLINEETLVLRI